MKIRDEEATKRVVKKWQSILESAKIDPIYWDDVALYCHRYANYEEEWPLNNLVMSIKVLSMLDLSRVMFTENKDMCDESKITFKVNINDLHDIEERTNFSVMTMLESSTVNELVHSIDEMMKQGKGVVIFEVVKIAVVKEPDTNTVILNSIMKPYDVHRYKKLKKVKSVLDKKQNYDI